MLCLVLLYLLAQIFAPFATPILWAMILARLFYPLYRRVVLMFRGRASLSAAVSTIAVTGLAVLPIAYLAFLAISETIHAYQDLVAWVQGGGMDRLAAGLGQLPVIGPMAQEAWQRGAQATEKLDPSLLAGGKAVGAVVVSSLGGLARGTFGVILDFFIMIFTLFFFFRDGKRLYAGFYDAVPIADAHKALIFERLDATMIAVIHGKLLTALAQGALAGIVYWALGVPFPIFLGALTALACLIPFAGTPLVWAPVAVYLFWTAPVWKGIAMVVLGVGLIGLVDNFLQPFIIGAGADLPVLFLFFATIGGLAYFGFIGLFLGPILLSIAFAAFQIYRDSLRRPALQPAAGRFRAEAGAVSAAGGSE